MKPLRSEPAPAKAYDPDDDSVEAYKGPPPPDKMVDPQLQAEVAKVVPPAIAAQVQVNAPEPKSDPSANIKPTVSPKNNLLEAKILVR
jgi:hypothetical protein